MESKSLKVIQTLSKIARIVSKIVFVCSIIGCASCLVGLVGLSSVVDVVISDGKTVKDVIEGYSNFTIGQMYASMAAAMIVTSGEIAISKMCERYFSFELEKGTPFTFQGARKILNLGIITISVSLGTTAISSAIVSIMSKFMEIPDKDISNKSGLLMGLFFIFLSFVFKYGSEVREKSEISEEK